MPSGTVVANIPASPQRVWEAITDFENAPTWVPDLLSVRRLDTGPLSVGSQFDQVMNVQGRKTEVKLTIRTFDAPTVIAHTGEGKSLKISGRATIEETPDGCRVTNDWGIELSGMLKLASPLAGRWTKSNIEQSMQALKRLLASEQ